MPIERIKRKLDSYKIKNTDKSFLFLATLFFKEIIDDDLDDIAKSIAFGFTLAIFPGIIFLFTLIPYIPIQDLNNIIMTYMQEVFPAAIYEFTSDTINDIISRPRGGLLSFGFLLALFSATNGTLAMMTGFNRCFRTSEKRGYFHTRFIALLITVVLTLSLVFSVILLVVGKIVVNYIVQLGFIEQNNIYYLFVVIQHVGVFVFFYFSIATIYYFGPTISKKSNFFSVGALFAAIMCITATILFGIYFENFASYNKVYGSIGTIIAFMFWLYIVSYVILIGFELNVSYLKIIHNHHDEDELHHGKIH